LEFRESREKRSIDRAVAESDIWRRGLISHVVISCVLGIMGAGFLELIVNYRPYAAFVTLEQSSTAKPSAWAFGVGISDSDCVVLLTSFVLLVATMNVALAAMQIGDRKSFSKSIRALSWADMSRVASALVGGASIALTLTRVGTNLGIFLVLTVVSIVVVLVGGSVTPDRSPTLQKVEKERLLRKLMDLQARVRETRLRYRIVGTVGAKAFSPAGYGARLLGPLLGVTAFISALVTGFSILAGQGKSLGSSSSEILASLVAIFMLTLVQGILYLGLQTFRMYAYCRGWHRIQITLLVAILGIAAAIVVGLVVSGLPVFSWVWWAIAATLLLVPASVLALSPVARARRVGFTRMTGRVVISSVGRQIATAAARVDEIDRSL
jgi:hypothetical protein